MTNDRIIVITSTYERPGRIEMLSHLKSVLDERNDVDWILVEDGAKKISSVEEFIPSYCTYLNVGPTKDFGHVQRNLAMEHVFENDMNGVIYNADDDNWYDPRIFGEIKKTRRVSVFPVGNLGPKGIERPIVKNGKFFMWEANWTDRKFPVDMAGFAFRSELLKGLSKPFWFHLERGGESEFLSKLVASPHDLEFLCNGCTKLFVKYNELLKTRT